MLTYKTMYKYLDEVDHSIQTRPLAAGSAPISTRPSRTMLILALVGLVGLVSLAACLVAGVLLLGPGRRSEPLVSTAGRLAFISDRDGPRELYLMNADGSQPTRLTYANGDIWGASWSPNGRYLAFVQGRVEQADIYILDVEAALRRPGQVAPLRLTDEAGFDGYPVWSPDEAWLVFGSSGRAPAGTYLVDVADFLIAPSWSEPTLLVAWVDYPAAWSPDGSHLAIEGTDNLAIVRADGLPAQAQTKGLDEAYLGGGQGPSWSPDGRQLVFELGGDLYRVNADGTSLLRLTDAAEDEYGAAWSPDGREIAYLSRSPRSSDMGQPYVMSAPGAQGQVNADGSKPRQLCSIGAAELAWSPDSTRLAFYSNRGRGPDVDGEIWVMNRDGSGLTPLTDHPAFDGSPIWRLQATLPIGEHVMTARATLETIRALAQRGVSRNAEWTPYIRELGGMPMALVPAGCFRMGRNAEEIAADLEKCRRADPGCGQPAGLEDQTPAHPICFDKPFWIGVNDVTVAQFRAWGELGACVNDRAGDNRPCQETWFGAAAFCEQYGLRLPSEAEWEYTARGPDDLLFPWGNNFAGDRLVWNASQAADVGSKPAGASWVGALDMLGNVLQWTSTWYAPYPYDPADGREAEGGNYERRVLRGHAWDDADQVLWESGVWSAATRRADWPASKPLPTYGFRCARSYE